MGVVNLNIKNETAPARWLSWLEHRRPLLQMVVGLISCQGSYLGRGLDSWSEHIEEPTLSLCLPLTLFLLLPPLPLSLKSINICSGRIKKYYSYRVIGRLFIIHLCAKRYELHNMFLISEHLQHAWHV